MRTMNARNFLPATVAAVVLALSIGGHARAPQRAGQATGTLTVGSATLQLSHAYAFPEKDKSDSTKEIYRIFVTDRPLTADAVKFAASAGENEDDRQQLVLELADRTIQGLEVLVAADARVLRANIYTADLAMGMMLLGPTEFEATTVDSRTIAGRLFTPAPIQDARISKRIQYEARFSASIHRGAGSFRAP